MTRTEVSKSVVTANWFDVVHATFTTEVTGRREVDLERFGVRAVEVRYCRTGHFQVVTAQEEQQGVTYQTDYVRD